MAVDSVWIGDAYAGSATGVYVAIGAAEAYVAGYEYCGEVMYTGGAVRTAGAAGSGAFA